MFGLRLLTEQYRSYMMLEAEAKKAGYLTSEDLFISVLGWGVRSGTSDIVGP